ncbi:hypothetical protein SY85_22675 [Flavisolibacter tropicus]|uniref:Uncharacterized protein n=1 Tax=Flavisolibacter tropicus TaxID=1492898 RepID=A0A172U0T0_9BACT|nr:hypothetical protein SY85_22675 [Flavisolibacter tropicus]
MPQSKWTREPRKKGLAEKDGNKKQGIREEEVRPRWVATSLPFFLLIGRPFFGISSRLVREFFEAARRIPEQVSKNLRRKGLKSPCKGQNCRLQPRCLSSVTEGKKPTIYR